MINSINFLLGENNKLTIKGTIYGLIWKERTTLKKGDNIEIIQLEDEDLGLGMTEGDTGIIESEDYLNSDEDELYDDIFNVRLTNKITVKSLNLNEDGTYQFYRYQLKTL